MASLLSRFVQRLDLGLFFLFLELGSLFSGVMTQRSDEKKHFRAVHAQEPIRCS